MANGRPLPSRQELVAAYRSAHEARRIVRRMSLYAGSSSTLVEGLLRDQLREAVRDIARVVERPNGSPEVHLTSNSVTVSLRELEPKIALPKTIRTCRFPNVYSECYTALWRVEEFLVPALNRNRVYPPVELFDVVETTAHGVACSLLRGVTSAIAGGLSRRFKAEHPGERVSGGTSWQILEVDPEHLDRSAESIITELQGRPWWLRSFTDAEEHRLRTQINSEFWVAVSVLPEQEQSGEYKHGPVEGTKRALAKLMERSEKALAGNSGKGAYLLVPVGGQSWELWFRHEGKAAEIRARQEQQEEPKRSKASQDGRK